MPDDNEMEAYAYASNSDGNGYSQINFCYCFFNIENLGDAIQQGKSKRSSNIRLNLATYQNRGKETSPFSR
jgi:hypothetical protein